MYYLRICTLRLVLTKLPALFLFFAAKRIMSSKKATVKYVEKLVNVIFSILKSGRGVKCLQSRLSHIIRRKMFFAHNAQV